MIRIIHVFDQAGVAFVLAKFQQLQGHESKVITTESSDKYGIKDFYSDQIIYVKSENEFLRESLKYAKSADVIHIHSRIDALLFLHKELGNSKRIILHYHGTDIRGLKRIKLPHRSRLSDLAIKSIYKYRTIHDKLLLKSKLHDTEHFFPDCFEKGLVSDKDALTMDTEATDCNLAMQLCRKNNIRINIDVYDRMKVPIMYKDMPRFLKRYAVYVDIRYVNGQLLPNLSKTALEALACGLRVLNYRLQYHDNLPVEHQPLNVLSRLQSIYTMK